MNHYKKNFKEIKDRKKEKKGESFIESTGKVVKVIGGSIFYVLCKKGKIEMTVRARIAAEYRSNKKKGVSSKISEGSIVVVNLSLNDPENGSMIVRIVS